MTKRRLIDGVVFQDRQFIALGLLAKVVYLGLWHTCDDWGHGKWSSQEVKGALFARDNRITAKVIASAMVEVETLNDVEVYEVDGWRYYNLMSWGGVNPKMKYHSVSDVPSPPKTGGKQLALDAKRLSSLISNESVQHVHVDVVSQVHVEDDVHVDGVNATGVTNSNFSIDWTDQNLTDLNVAAEKGGYFGPDWLVGFLVGKGVTFSNKSIALQAARGVFEDFPTAIIGKALSQVLEKPREVKTFFSYLRSACANELDPVKRRRSKTGV